MAVGIGLVFGVLRIVNFAYGQLIMAGAYTLALTNGWNPALSIAMCFVIVIGLSILMDVVRFQAAAARRAGNDADRDLRGLAPPLLHRAAQIHRAREDGRNADRTQPADRGRNPDRALDLGRRRDRRPRRPRRPARPANRTNLGLHMRAAAADFRTARMLGVRANPTIMARRHPLGRLAAVVAVLMTAETPYVTPDYALRDTIVVLVGVVVGGLDRLWTAALGGFSIGFVTCASRRRAAELRHWPFTSASTSTPPFSRLVILTLLLRPDGLFVGRRHRAVERV